MNVFSKNGGEWNTSELPQTEYKNIWLDTANRRFNLKKKQEVPIFGQTLPLVSTMQYAWVNGELIDAANTALIRAQENTQFNNNPPNPLTKEGEVLLLRNDVKGMLPGPLNVTPYPANGRPNYHRIAVKNNDFLTHLYDIVYRADNNLDSVVVYNNDTSVAIQLDRNSYDNPNNGFGLNYQKLLQNAALAVTRDQDPTPTPTGKQPSIDDYDDLMEDLATGKYYRNKSGKLYTYVNGQEVEYGDGSDEFAKLSLGDKCFTVGNYNNDDCKRIIDCLADGNAAALGHCLNTYRDENLWRAAREDIKNSHPTIIRHVLANKFKFGGIKSTQDGYVRVESFESWLNKQPAEMQKVYQSSPGLTSYLKALIVYTNRNLAIFNKNYVQGGTNMNNGSLEMSEYVKMLKLNRARNGNPSGSQDNFSKLYRYKVALNDLASQMSPPVLEKDIFNEIFGVLSNKSLYHPAVNVSLGFGKTMAGGGGSLYLEKESSQTGGFQFFTNTSGSKQQVKTCASTLTSQFDYLKQELSKIGYTISNDDNIRITNAISELDKLQKKLYKMYGLYRQFTVLGAYSGLQKPPTGVNKTLEFKDIKTSEDLTNYVRVQVDEMRKSLNSLMTGMNTLQQDILNTLAASAQSALNTQSTASNTQSTVSLRSNL